MEAECPSTPSYRHYYSMRMLSVKLFQIQCPGKKTNCKNYIKKLNKSSLPLKLPMRTLCHLQRWRSKIHYTNLWSELLVFLWKKQMYKFNKNQRTIYYRWLTSWSLVFSFFSFTRYSILCLWFLCPTSFPFSSESWTFCLRRTSFSCRKRKYNTS